MERLLNGNRKSAPAAGQRPIPGNPGNPGSGNPGNPGSGNMRSLTSSLPWMVLVVYLILLVYNNHYMATVQLPLHFVLFVVKPTLPVVFLCTVLVTGVAVLVPLTRRESALLREVQQLTAEIHAANKEVDDLRHFVRQSLAVNSKVTVPISLDKIILNQVAKEPIAFVETNGVAAPSLPGTVHTAATGASLFAQNGQRVPASTLQTMAGYARELTVIAAEAAGKGIANAWMLAQEQLYGPGVQEYIATGEAPPPQGPAQPRRNGNNGNNGGGAAPGGPAVPAAEPVVEPAAELVAEPAVHELEGEEEAPRPVRRPRRASVREPRIPVASEGQQESGEEEESPSSPEEGTARTSGRLRRLRAG